MAASFTPGMMAGSLSWQSEAINSDLGFIMMDMEHGGCVKGIHYYFDRITDGPCEVDLTVEIETVMEIFTDPQFGLTPPSELAPVDMLG